MTFRVRVVIAGSSGLIGTALARSLTLDGHEVIRLVRRPPASAAELRWDPAGAPVPALLDGADAVVNLAGAGLGTHRWTKRYQRILLESRTTAAAALAEMAARADRPPSVMISASGMRYYGVDRGDEPLTEVSAHACSGFLPMVAREWEAATGAATRAGVRVCHLRLGFVLSGAGGILPTLLPLFRIGLGGPLGTGREFWSYVSLPDATAAIKLLMTAPGAAGPYNITAPEPVRSWQFARALAQTVHRPAAGRVPAWLVRAAMGGPITEVLGSLRVLPARLTEAGFRHAHPDLGSVLRAALGDMTPGTRMRYPQ